MKALNSVVQELIEVIEELKYNSGLILGRSLIICFIL